MRPSFVLVLVLVPASLPDLSLSSILSNYLSRYPAPLRPHPRPRRQPPPSPHQQLKHKQSQQLPLAPSTLAKLSPLSSTRRNTIRENHNVLEHRNSGQPVRIKLPGVTAKGRAEAEYKMRMQNSIQRPRQKQTRPRLSPPLRPQPTALQSPKHRKEMQNFQKRLINFKQIANSKMNFPKNFKPILRNENLSGAKASIKQQQFAAHPSSFQPPPPSFSGLGHSQGEARPSFITKHLPGPGPGAGAGAVVGRNQTKIGPVNRVTNLLADASFSFRNNRSTPFNAVGPVNNAMSPQSQQMEALDNIRPEVWV